MPGELAGGDGMNTTKGISTAARSARVELTTRPYVRSHMRAPGRNQDGLWAVQQTSTDIALEAHRVGAVIFLPGTLAEVRAELAARGHAGLWAVLP